MTNRMRLLVGALLIVSSLNGAARTGRQEARGRADVGDFLRRIHTEGISYDTAKQYASEGSEIPFEMLGNVDDAQYWPNVTMVLGASGNAELVKPLIDFLHGNLHGERNDTWSTAVYRGRASAIMALGYLVHDTGDPEAMEYLRDSVDHRIWSQREIPWLRTRGATRGDSESERLSMLLSTSAVVALALTGQHEAAAKLRELTDTDDAPARLRQVAESVLPDWEKINEAGLSEYYRTREQGAPHAATSSRR